MCIRAPWWQLNRISHSGLLIIDNEGIQGGKLTTNTTFKFNWVFDAGGLGLRFDTGEEGLFGSNNNLQFNVVFRNSQGGLSGKSDNASNYRNTGTDNQGGTDVEAGGFTGGAVDMKICHCYPASCEGERSGVPVMRSPTTTPSPAVMWASWVPARRAACSTRMTCLGRMTTTSTSRSGPTAARQSASGGCSIALMRTTISAQRWAALSSTRVPRTRWLAPS